MFSKFKTVLAGSAVLGGALLVATAAFAVPIGLPNGGISAHLTGVESVNSSNNDVCRSLCGAANTPVGAYNGTETNGGVVSGGEGLWGVFVIDQLQNASEAGGTPHSDLTPGGAFWNTTATGVTADGHTATAGQQILAVFYGANQITGPGTSPSLAKWGVIDLYWWDSNNQGTGFTQGTSGDTLRSNASINGLAGSGYTGYSCDSSTPAAKTASEAAGCYFLAEFQLVPENPHGAGGPTSQYSATDVTSAAGAGYFEAEVNTAASATGYWTKLLANDYFTYNNPALFAPPFIGPPLLNTNGTTPDASDLNGVADVRPCGTGCPAGVWTNGVPIHVSDPVQLFAVNVPEPGTLSLFGMGLLGFGFMNRRRRQKQA